MPDDPTVSAETPEADEASDPVASDAVDADTVDAGDPVTTLVERVRTDLAARRANGSLPPLPPDELARQFSAVVEAADSGVIDAPPLDPGRLAELATLPSPGSGPSSGPVLARLRRRALRPVRNRADALVRHQVGGFSQRVSDLLTEVIHRQNNIIRFLMRAHLDRVRTLEHRVAALEQEVARLRAPRDET